MAPAEILVNLWSYLSSLWLLLGLRGTRAFSFKYSKALDAPSTGEEQTDGGLQIELTDFAHDLPRQLEMSTLKGVGTFLYRTGLPEMTSAVESKVDTSGANIAKTQADSGAHPTVDESSLPGQEGK
ncbi:hypothetical protein BKA70DRAFT_1234990 [Coprinopsis sp. MPI-PUGE-AT-0042]|nr:hypothetical protein BKA70DRAFT_1234990 [Coprinopsis sp. MPI-PUGE-AT-0042]